MSPSSRSTASRDGAALGEWPGQEGLLPGAAAHFAAEGLVGAVVQALGIAVDEQQGLAAQFQADRFRQCQHAGGRKEAGADQEVPIAGQEGDGQPLCCRPQQVQHLPLEAAGFVQAVVAHPDLEQVAEDEHRIGRCGGQVLRQRVRRVGCGRSHLQVRQHVHLLPALRAAQHRAVGRVLQLPGALHQSDHSTTTARWITTSSSGTSSWKPLRPVRTFSIWSTTSVPDTTLPNTA